MNASTLNETPRTDAAIERGECGPDFARELESDFNKVCADYFAANTSLATARELLQEVISIHADPSSADYNECDKSPCTWCETAIRLTSKGTTDKPKNRPDRLNDGFGNIWTKCAKDCGLEIVRPGKVQCEVAHCPLRNPPSNGS